SDLPDIKNITHREKCFQPLWKFYLSNPDLAIDQYSSAAVNTIPKLNFLDNPGSLVLRETQAPSNPIAFFGSFTSQIFVHGNPASGNFADISRNSTKFLKGLGSLSNTLTKHVCAPHSLIKDTFADLRVFGSQSLYVRAAGAFIVAISSTDPDLAATLV